MLVNRSGYKGEGSASLSRVAWCLRSEATEHASVDFRSTLSASESLSRLLGSRGCVHLIPPNSSSVVRWGPWWFDSPGKTTPGASINIYDRPSSGRSPRRLSEEAAPSWALTAGAWEKQMFSHRTSGRVGAHMEPCKLTEALATKMTNCSCSLLGESIPKRPDPGSQQGDAFRFCFQVSPSPRHSGSLS